MKRFISVLVVIVLMMSMVNPSIAVAKDAIPDGFTPIYTVQDLYGIANNPKGSYILMNDIDLSETKPGGSLDTGNGWSPLDLSGGEFNGNGHIIKNLNIYGRPKDPNGRPDMNVGLFSICGKVSNLALVDVNIDIKSDFSILDASSRSVCTGAICGIGQKITSCFATGKIKYESDVCISYVQIGGLGGNVSDISNCYSDIDINVHAESYESYTGIGGIAGKVNSYEYNVGNCYALGNIDVTNSGQHVYVGACFGRANAPSGCDLCFYPYSSVFIGQETLNICGEKALSSSQMSMSECYTGFDFYNTWYIDSNSSYPYPQLKACPQCRLKSIELVKAPDKTEYITTDKELDLTGGTVKLEYEDGHIANIPITSSMVSYRLNVGEQTVTVKYANLSTSFIINVLKAESEVSAIDEKTIAVGESFQLDIKGYTSKTTITPSKEGIVYISSSNTVTGVHAGTVDLVINNPETDTNKASSFTTRIIVTKKKPTLTVNNTTALTTTVGESISITAKTNSKGAISYVASEDGIVSIDSYGKVTPLKSGTVNIKVEVAETEEYESVSSVVKLVINKKNPTLSVSDSIIKDVDDEFNIKVKCDSDGQVSYNPLEDGIIDIDSNGAVSVIKAGVVNVSVEVPETEKFKGISKTITVTINKGTPKIKAKSSFNKKKKAKFSIGASVDKNVSLKYKSSKPAVVSVNSKGRVVCKKKGTATITVYTIDTDNYEAVKKKIKVKVK